MAPAVAMTAAAIPDHTNPRRREAVFARADSGPRDAHTTHPVEGERTNAADRVVPV